MSKNSTVLVIEKAWHVEFKCIHCNEETADWLYYDKLEGTYTVGCTACDNLSTIEITKEDLCKLIQ